MKTLLLLRHAKSDRDDPRLQDPERPLAKRGIKAAKLMAAVMARTAVTVDRVYCSTARRTRETYELIAPALGGAVVSFLEDLYLADTSQLMRVIYDLPAGARSVMLIGHNPGFHDLALDLIPPSAASKDGNHLREKFPTAALCTLEFAARTWREARPGTGRLESFIRPRDFA